MNIVKTHKKAGCCPEHGCVLKADNCPFTKEKNPHCIVCKQPVEPPK